MTRFISFVLACAVGVDVLAKPVPKDFGPQLLYVAKKGEKAQLFLINADGTNAKELTDAKSNVSYPAWSPDGKRVAFSSDREGGVMQIFAMDISGANLVQVTRERQHCRVPAWSPDGKRLAFCTYGVRGGSEIRLVPADGGKQTALDGDAWDPAFSPDGKSFAFVSYREGTGYKLYTMDVDGKNQKKLTDNPNPIGLAYPAWSPDGKRIAYTDHIDRNLELFVVDADGKNRVQLTKFSGSSVYPAWSPDGKQLAILQYKDATKAALVVMDADGKNAKTLVKDLVAVEGGRPLWRPKK
jgi:TolB protein